MNTVCVLFVQQPKSPRTESNKSNKVFVGGIPHNCGEAELRDYFKRFGVVSVSVYTSPAKVSKKLKVKVHICTKNAKLKLAFESHGLQGWIRAILTGHVLAHDHFDQSEST